MAKDQTSPKAEAPLPDVAGDGFDARAEIDRLSKRCDALGAETQSLRDQLHRIDRRTDAAQDAIDILELKVKAGVAGVPDTLEARTCALEQLHARELEQNLPNPRHVKQPEPVPV